MRILIAEDDPGLRSVLSKGLRDSGYQVDAAENGDEALAYLGAYDYEVAILDWRMPGTSGLDVTRRLRRDRRPTAVLMLTALDTSADRVAGLDAGADDYVVKPFDFPELLARVRALQRRPRGVEGPPLRRGRVELDCVTRTASVGGAALPLTATELRILELLLRRAPALVERRHIAQHAWQDETEPIGSNSIDAHMARLRAKLAECEVRIVTVRGSGYRLEET